MPRPGPPRIPILTREHEDRYTEIKVRAATEELSVSALLRRFIAYGLLNMPSGWTDPNPPSEQGDG